jgi:hypothetical protein
VACAHAPPLVAPPLVASTAGGVEIRAEGRDGEAADQVARVLPGAIERVERWGPLPRPVLVRIQPSAEALATAAGRPGDTWLRGWARLGSVEIQSPRSWSRGAASDAALGTLLAHELSHCLLFSRLPGDWTRRDVPTWFEEGMASYTAGEHHARADAAALGRPAPGTRAVDPAVAYGTADRAFRRLIALHGDAAVRAILRELADGRRFPDAFRSATGGSLASFEASFRRELEASAAR